MENSRFKFRVWDKVSKRYFYLELKFGDNGYHPDFITDPVFEQCTCLKDKNGELIYEGDIVKCDRDFDDGRVGLIKKVAFFDGAFCLGNLDGFDWYYLNKFHNIEIIGNVHEQAEQGRTK